jgi:glycosyltransferase involved in cell wall biosynthesis
MTPKFSICIPTYNRGHDLLFTIKSVIDQTYTNWELIIIDDSTNNDTKRVVDSFNNSKILFIKNKIRLGLVKNWNRCLELANNEYIQILHHDDILLPNSLELYTNFIVKNKDVMFLHGDAYTTNAPYFDKLNYCVTQDKKVLHKGDEAVLKVLFNHNFACSSVVINKKIIESLGYFDTNAWVSPDYEYYARIGKSYNFYHVDKPIVVFITHSKNTHISGYTFDSFLYDNLYYQEKVLGYLSENSQKESIISNKILKNAFLTIGINLLFSKKYSESYKCLKYSEHSKFKIGHIVLKKIIKNLYYPFLFKKRSYEYLYDKLKKHNGTIQ